MQQAQRREGGPVVWRCLKSIAWTRASDKDGCGEPNIIVTTKRNGDRKNKWQGLCPRCGKKKNLKPANVKIFDGPDYDECLAEAQFYVDGLRDGTEMW